MQADNEELFCFVVTVARERNSSRGYCKFAQCRTDLIRYGTTSDNGVYSHEFVLGAVLKPEKPSSKAESGIKGFSGRGSPLSTSLGSAVSSPGEVWGGARTKKCILDA